MPGNNRNRLRLAKAMLDSHLLDCRTTNASIIEDRSMPSIHAGLLRKIALQL